MKQFIVRILAGSVLIASSLSAVAQQTCQNKDEAPEPVRKAVEAVAQQTFDQSSSGDINSLKANAIPSLQSNFNGIAAAVNDNKDAIKGTKAQLRSFYLLDTGATPGPDGVFYCGVFGADGMSPSTAEFDLPGLPVGKYAIAIQDFNGSKGPYSLTVIFQDMSGWKVAGYYIRPESSLGHDGLWYLQQARDYKSKGEAHNAWFYYLTSWDLLTPVTFMNTKMLGKITQESNSIQPKDVPVGGNPVTFTAAGKSYKITDMSVYKTDKDFDLAIKYSVPSTSDFNGTQADARNLANALIAQYPELKTGFNNIWAHAVDPNGAEVVGIVKLK